MEEKKPLVSIIVRTKDRPKMLRSALHSISAQTYRSIEVVLVNDGGCDLNSKELKEILGDISLNYIRLKENVGRADAGNAGIENAQGEYIGFLDDDDELYPEHLSILVSFLEQTDYKVAYTDAEIRCRDFEPEERKMVDVNKTVLFSKDFSYEELFVRNYIPFMCLLFEKKVLTSSGGFDRTFDLYEDWELLIRIAEIFPFYHIKKVNAIYNQWSRELQINQANLMHMRLVHSKIINKHREKITPEIVLNMKDEQERVELELKNLSDAYRTLEVALSDTVKEKDRHISHLDEIIRAKDRHISNLDEIVREKENHISQLELSLYQMKDTIGWRFIEKLRRARDKVLPHGSRRRKIFDVVIKSIKYLQIEGGKRLLNKILERSGLSFFLLSHKDPYKLWILKNEPPENKLKDMGKDSHNFKYRPKISIITPVYNVDKRWLKLAIESVINQVYDNWELCIADGGSTFPHVRDIIEEYVKKDERIKVTFLPENRGIAGNSNEALSLATGELIGFLDHDDELTPSALYEVVKLLNANRDIDFIYSDEDKISTRGARFEPHFKPDWSPDYFLSNNYICHFTVIKKSIIDKIKGFREGYDGSQDYDLFLRATEIAHNIAHIPKILYNWRIIQGSAAGLADAKPYAFESAKKALKSAVKRRGYDCYVVDGAANGFYRIRYKILGNPEVSIIIPTRDKSEILRNCIDSIFYRSSYRNYKIVIVDNQSREEDTFKYYQGIGSNPKISIINYDRAFNYADINNHAVTQVDSEYIVFLNNDVEVISPGWIEAMLEFVQRKDVGAVGARLYYPNEKIQHAGVIISMGGVAGHPHCNFPKDSHGYFGRITAIQNFSAVTAACLMIRKEVFDEVGGFDGEYSHAFNDVDFCLKIRQKGYLIVYTPYAELYHHESLSRGYEDTVEKKMRFKKEIDCFQTKWKDVLANGDPYYNPNLTLKKEDFSLRI